MAAVKTPDHEPVMPSRGVPMDVPLSSLLDHPLNDNFMNPAELRKLRAHIMRNKGKTERLVVRQLTPESEWWPKDAPVGAVFYQVLSGHQRLRVFRDLQVSLVAVDVWPDVSDDAGLLLLATFNDLHGERVVAKRAELLTRAVGGLKASEVDELLVETEAQLREMAALIQRTPEAPSATSTMEADDFEDWHCILSSDQLLVVQAAYDDFASKVKGKNKKGRFLELLSAHYLAGPPDLPDGAVGP